MSGERIGVFGGTFNPIHIAHLILGEEARAQLKLDRVVYVPAEYPWRKGDEELAPGAHRLAMTRLATESNPDFAVSSVDLDRGGATYSVDTIHDLRAESAEDAEFYFLMGMDSLLDLPNWHTPQALAEMVRFAVFRRPNYSVDVATLEKVIPGISQRVTQLEAPLMGISSTVIRRRVATGQSIHYWVPDAVADYIHQHGLYKA